MMFKIAKPVCLGAMLLAGVSMPAVAADLYEPQVVEAPAPVQVAPVATGGWYIRGDLDYHWSDFRGADYITYGPPPGTNTVNDGKLDGAWSIGGGVGYKINSYLRTDVTADYLFKSDFSGSTAGSSCGGAGPCSSVERGSYSGWLLLANAYADLGTYHGITPYVGAGIGGAHIKWDDLHDPNTTERNGGTSSWRFAYAFMAGASYCVTRNISLDVGYRFTHINGGRMFEYAPVAGPGFDKGINVNEVRAGLRYSFGGNSGDGCEEPQVAYQPPAPEPVYK